MGAFYDKPLFRTREAAEHFISMFKGLENHICVDNLQQEGEFWAVDVQVDDGCC